MAYEAINYDKAGNPLSDVRAVFDRAWILNGYEQCSFAVAVKQIQENIEHYESGNHLVITDTVLDVWGGQYDLPESWTGTGIITKHAYSGERLFSLRPASVETEISGTAGVVYRKIVDIYNSVIPFPSLLQIGEVYEGGETLKEKVSLKALYEDVTRISENNGQDFWVEPVIENRVLHYEANWALQRGTRKNFALLEGVNVERSNNVMEVQGEIWNYIIAAGEGATEADKPRAVAFDLASIERYGPRAYPLSVNSDSVATVKAAADAFVAANAWPMRTFNLVVGGQRVGDSVKNDVFSVLRIGDTVDLGLYSIGNDNGRIGTETVVRILGMTHRGAKNTMDLLVGEVL